MTGTKGDGSGREFRGRARRASRAPMLVLAVLMVVAVAAFTRADPARDTEAAEQIDMQKLLRGRQLVIEHACSGCHGGSNTPDGGTWMVGVTDARPELVFLIGPCLWEPGAEPCFRTRPRNLTPDNRTGIGRFTERQIFNALRYGLRPGETADVDITSATPGMGNHPTNPKYLAPPMPWPAWRHIPDEDLWAIAYYLKNGVKPVENLVEDSDGPPDFWADAYTPEAIGPHPAVPFPAASEVRPTAAGVDMQQVLRGRQVVIQHDCGACHGGGTDPRNADWLAGVMEPTDEFPIGPCAIEPGTTPCFWMRPRNLTPHATTGIGRFSDRQIFNALRFGLRPEATPDVEITSGVPGQGNHPANPDYLGPGMPWMNWRYMPDADLWAAIAYLRHGVRPLENDVPDSDRVPDNWAGEYTVEKIGPYPAPPYPTAREVRH